MQPTTFDDIAKLFAARRLSRRQALMRGGAGLAAAGLAAAGIGSAAAAQPPVVDALPIADGEWLPMSAASTVAPAAARQFTVLEAPAAGATAIATPAVTEAAKPTTFLFLQSFETGSLVPKPGASGRYTLTLRQGLGETVYFSDRPQKIVGTVPTSAFLQGLGFPPDNPPNAALIGHHAANHKDVVVLELFDPKYDTTTNTATYEVALLQDWHKLDEEFQQTPDDEQQLPRNFTAAHLFIDDCADGNVVCCPRSKTSCMGANCGCKPAAGRFDNVGFCWDWAKGCCRACATDWRTRCNQTFADCKGDCMALGANGFGTCENTLT